MKNVKEVEKHVKEGFSQFELSKNVLHNLKHFDLTPTVSMKNRKLNKKTTMLLSSKKSKMKKKSQTYKYLQNTQKDTEQVTFKATLTL